MRTPTISFVTICIFYVLSSFKLNWLNHFPFLRFLSTALNRYPIGFLYFSTIEQIIHGSTIKQSINRTSVF